MKYCVEMYFFIKFTNENSKIFFEGRITKTLCSLVVQEIRPIEIKGLQTRDSFMSVKLIH